jgi:probable phosphoglycerate mutase
MDSKLVIEQMAGRWGVKHANLKPLAMRARALIPAYDRVSWTWVPRAQNGHADRLANLALDGKSAEVVVPPSGDEVTVRTDAAAPKIIGWARDLGSTTTFRLLRHGQTEHTLQRRFSGGSSDPALTEIGHRQANVTARHLATTGGLDLIVSSPLQRARQTAAAVAAALGIDVVIDEDLRECHFGVWDGLTFEEVREGWPEELAAWLASFETAPPGGESMRELAGRVAAAQERLLDRHAGQNVLVVAHVSPIKMLIRFALDGPEHLVHKLQLAPASLSTVCWYGDGNSALHSFNDTGHLGALARVDGT